MRDEPAARGATPSVDAFLDVSGMMHARMPPDASPLPAPNHLRLFLALWPDDGTRERIGACASSWRWPPGAARVPLARLHATLHFLGSVPRERLDAITHGLCEVFEPFTQVWDRCEVWRHGLAALACETPQSELLALHDRLRLRVAGLGLPTEDRTWLPHVTLARRATGAHPPADGCRIEWNCTAGYALVESLAQGQGYRVLRFYR